MKFWDYYGTPLPKLEEGEVGLGAVVSLKMMDAEGNIRYMEFKAPEIHSVEALGMLNTFTDTIRAHITSNARPAD